MTPVIGIGPGDACLDSGVAESLSPDRISAAVDQLERRAAAAKTFFRDVTRMPQGTIKKKTDKGFGFIKTESGADLFFHSSNVEGSGYESLREGQKVSYTEGRGPKGPRAENVRPL